MGQSKFEQAQVAYSLTFPKAYLLFTNTPLARTVRFPASSRFALPFTTSVDSSFTFNSSFALALTGFPSASTTLINAVELDSFSDPLQQ